VGPNESLRESDESDPFRGKGSKYGPVLALSDGEPVELGFTLDSKELRFG
jgi:hypothetical protein